MRRRLLPFAVGLVLVLVGFAGTVHALNSEVYSAHGFVRAYLNALERHQVAEALEFDGVVVPAGAARDLLTDEALGDLTDIHLLSDVAISGAHVVRFAAVVAGEERTLEFHVEPTGVLFGLFSMWRFDESPVATLVVASERDSRAIANGIDIAVGEYPVLVPATITLDHESAYLEADTTQVAVTTVGGRVEGVVEVTAKPTLDEAASAAVEAYLTTCVTQRVLMPTGCPMGKAVANRVNDEPTWTLLESPEVHLGPGEVVGEWRSEEATGLAHLSVEVKAILDGAISRFNKDVSFSAVYVVTIATDDSLSVTVDFD
jgi:hypothetical protein